MNKITTIRLKINGMHCSSCAMNIDFDLEDLPGVIKAQTNYAKSETIVEYDCRRVTKEVIIGQINKTGYQTKPII